VYLKKMSANQIFNVIQIDDQILTAGQPNEDQLRYLSTEGYKLVINLATIDPRYSLNDEEKSCDNLGMTYVHIPVEWAAPNIEDYRAFKDAMDESAQMKTLIHCAANYRVTAFYSIYAKQNLGWSDEQAKALRAQIWESNPEWKMDDIWREFIEAIDV
jgi:protein tyrosine phosphatase (PTP) superfamily phosphohydrolase (DUF442 family)